MADRPIPQINYQFAPRDGHNVFREKFGHLSDDDWAKLLARSISEPVIDGVQFPAFPEEELQNRVHGHSGAHSIAEADGFFKFIKMHTYGSPTNAVGRRILDFGSGWGRILRLFMRDFDFVNIYGFEPDFLLCALARSLNPYVTFFSGDFKPTGGLPERFFDLMVGWSIFSHLSPSSATAWLTEAARVVVPGGYCVFTTWGDRFLQRLSRETHERREGKEIHWYSSVCIDAAGSINQRLSDYEKGEFVWFTAGRSILYGEAFVGEGALRTLISQNQLPFAIKIFDKTTLDQDAFVLRRL